MQQPKISVKTHVLWRNQELIQVIYNPGYNLQEVLKCTLGERNRPCGVLIREGWVRILKISWLFVVKMVYLNNPDRRTDFFVYMKPLQLTLHLFVSPKLNSICCIYDTPCIIQRAQYMMKFMLGDSLVWYAWGDMRSGLKYQKKHFLKSSTDSRISCIIDFILTYNSMRYVRKNVSWKIMLHF
jgi:hypothetical protein